MFGRSNRSLNEMASKFATTPKSGALNRLVSPKEKTIGQLRTKAVHKNAVIHEAGLDLTKSSDSEGSNAPSYDS